MTKDNTWWFQKYNLRLTEFELIFFLVGKHYFYWANFLLSIKLKSYLTHSCSTTFFIVWIINYPHCEFKRRKEECKRRERAILFGFLYDFWNATGKVITFYTGGGILSEFNSTKSFSAETISPARLSRILWP